MTRRRWQVSAVALVVAIAAGVGGTAQQSAATPDRTAKHTVKVGIIYSRTGLLSAYGAQYIQGLRLGLEYMTKGTNRVAGHRIEITTVDDATDATKAVSAAKDLIGQGYKILAGTVASGVALQLAPLAGQNRVLYISGPATSDALTGHNRYTFRSGRQSLQDVLAVREILGKQVGRKIVVFAQDSAFGKGNVAAVKELLGTRGHRVEQILVPLSAQDFTPFARQAKAENPNLLFVAWAGTTAPAMWRALEQQGATESTKVATGLAERNQWSIYPPKLNFLSHYVAEAPKNKVNTWLRNRMRRNGQTPDLFTPDGFVAAQMIVRAVQKGGGSDVDRMISALEGWKFSAPKGAQQVRKSDHAMLQPMFHVRLKQSGAKFKAVPVARFQLNRA